MIRLKHSTAIAWLTLLLSLGADPVMAHSSTVAAGDQMSVLARRNLGGELMKLMLQGQDPNVRNADFETALHVALREESEKAVEALLKHPGLDVNAINMSGETPLMLAAIKGRLAWVKALVAKGALINESGWTALHYACSGPDQGVTAWLIQQGADINALSPNGSTPLMMAARYGAIQSAEVLLQAGADTRLRNQQGLSAVDFARSAGRDGLVRRLNEVPATRKPTAQP